MCSIWEHFKDVFNFVLSSKKKRYLKHLVFIDCFPKQKITRLQTQTEIHMNLIKRKCVVLCIIILIFSLLFFAFYLLMETQILKKTHLFVKYNGYLYIF